jgi:hypothetical protein
MNKTVFRITSTVALAVILGCATVSTTGGTNPVPGAPGDRAAAVTERLVRAYEGRDVGEFMTLVSARYLGGYEDLQAALEDTFGTVVSVELDVKPERTWESEEGTVLTDVSWAKTIRRGGAGGAEVTFGRATLVFIRYNADVLKLLSQKGDPVFP